MKNILIILLYIIACSPIFGQATGVVYGDYPTGGSMGTASTTVDANTLMNITQTTPGQTIILPNPSNSSAGKNITLNNIGTVSFTLVPGGILYPNTGVIIRWSGLNWAVTGSGIATVLQAKNKILASPISTSGYISARILDTSDISFKIPSYKIIEIDPTVPTYAKTLTGFSVLKTSTDLLYEPIFSKNTAFNKNFGTAGGTITEGSDSRVINGQAAFTWGNHAGLYPLLSEAYSNPSWITTLDNSKVTGLGSAALTASSTYATATQGILATTALQPNGSGSALIGITPTQIGLGSVDNTSDATKNSASSTLTNKIISTGTNTISGLTNANLNGSAGISDANITSASIWSGKQNLITTGTTAQYLKGDLSLGLFPTNLSFFTNGPGYITGINGSNVVSALGYTPYNNTNPNNYIDQSGGRSAISIANTGSGNATYNPSTGVLNVPTPVNQTIALAGDVTGIGATSITTTLANSGVTAGTYEFITVNAKGLVTGGYNSITNSLTARVSGTAYQASNTSRTYDLDFTITISNASVLIAAGDGKLILETSPNGTTGWAEYTQGRSSIGGVVASTGSNQQLIAFNIPAGYYYRLVYTTVSGTSSWAYIEGHETLRR